MKEDLNCEKCNGPMDILHCEEIFRNEREQVLNSTSLYCSKCQIFKKLKNPLRIYLNL